MQDLNWGAFDHVSWKTFIGVHEMPRLCKLIHEGKFHDILPCLPEIHAVIISLTAFDNIIYSLLSCCTILNCVYSLSHAAYEEQVVAFFRQADIVAITSERYRRGVRPQLRDIIAGIRMEGTTALERIQMSGSIATYELAIVLR